MITREILEWVDDRQSELTETNFKNCVKAFGLGMIEGAVDGCVVIYPIVVGTLFVVGKIISKNR